MNRIPPMPRGFTLLEMLGAMSLLTMALGLGSMVLLSAMRLQRTALGDLQRQTWRKTLADEFRADVAGASAAPDTVEWPAGPDKGGQSGATLMVGAEVLILRTGDKKHVIYRWKKGRLERLEIAGGKTMMRELPLGSDCVEVEFARSGAKGEIVVLRLTDSLGKSKLTRTSEIAAALGGDLR